MTIPTVLPGRGVTTLVVGAPTSEAVLLPRGRAVLASGLGGLTLFDLHTGAPGRVVFAERGWGLHVDPDGLDAGTIAAGPFNESIRLVRVPLNGRPPRDVPLEFSGGAVHVAFSPGGAKVAVDGQSLDREAGCLKTLRVFDGRSGALLVDFYSGDLNRETGGALVMHPDGDRLFQAFGAGFVVWSCAARAQVLSVAGDGPLVGPIALRRDGERLATCTSGSGALRVYATASGQRVGEVEHVGGPTWALAWHPDGERLFVGVGGGVWLYDPRTGGRERVYDGVSSLVHSVAVSEGDEAMVVCTGDRHVVVIDVALQPAAPGWRASIAVQSVLAKRPLHAVALDEAPEGLPERCAGCDGAKIA